jgi:hypothetical protein
VVDIVLLEQRYYLVFYFAFGGVCHNLKYSTRLDKVKCF